MQGRFASRKVSDNVHLDFRVFTIINRLSNGSSMVLVKGIRKRKNKNSRVKLE